MHDEIDRLTIFVRWGRRQSKHSFSNFVGTGSSKQLLELPDRIILCSCFSVTGTNISNLGNFSDMTKILSDISGKPFIMFSIFSEKKETKSLAGALEHS